MIKIIEPNPLENTLNGHIKLLSLIITIKLQSVVAKIYTVIKSKRFTLKPDHLYFMVNCSVLSLVRFHLLRFTYFLEVLLLYKLNECYNFSACPTKCLSSTEINLKQEGWGTGLFFPMPDTARPIPAVPKSYFGTHDLIKPIPT